MTITEEITLESTISDYCREESQDEGELECAKDEWINTLSSVGAAWTDESSCTGVEIAFTMTLKQAFGLALNEGWFGPEGFYGESVPVTLAGLINLEGRERYETQVPEDVAAITALWDAFKADPANRRAEAQEE